MDGIASIEFCPLGGRDAQQQIRVGQDGATTVDADEDIQDLVEVLSLLFEVADDPVFAGDRVQTIESLEGELALCQAGRLDVIVNL